MLRNVSLLFFVSCVVLLSGCSSAFITTGVDEAITVISFETASSWVQAPSSAWSSSTSLWPVANISTPVTELLNSTADAQVVICPALDSLLVIGGCSVLSTWNLSYCSPQNDRQDIVRIPLNSNNNNSSPPFLTNAADPAAVAASGNKKKSLRLSEHHSSTASSSVGADTAEDDERRTTTSSSSSSFPWGIRGPHATVLYNSTLLVFFRACTVFSFDEATSDLYDQTPEVALFDLEFPSRGWVSVTSAPSNSIGFGGRVNGSCIRSPSIANDAVLIIGGGNRTTGEGVLDVGLYRIDSHVFVPMWTSLDSPEDMILDAASVALRSPLSVASLDAQTSLALIPVRSKTVPQEEYAYVWTFTTSPNCRDVFPTMSLSSLMPLNEVSPTTTTTSSNRLSSGVVMAGTTLLVTSATTRTVLALPLIPPQAGSSTSWTVVSNLNTSGSFQHRSRNSNTEVSFAGPVWWSSVIGLPQRAGFSAQLELLSFTGMVTNNNSSSTSFVARSLATSVSSVALPASLWNSTTPVETNLEGLVQFPLSDGSIPFGSGGISNASTWASLAQMCGPDVLMSPCVARLSTSPTCNNRAAGSLDAIIAFHPNAAETSAVFQLTASVSNVFLCMSYGTSNALWRTCNTTTRATKSNPPFLNHAHRSVGSTYTNPTTTRSTTTTASSLSLSAEDGGRFFPLNPQSPLTITLRSTTPAPTNPSHGPHSLSSSTMIALYTCVAVAAVAVLAVFLALARYVASRHRRSTANDERNSDDGLRGTTENEKKALLEKLNRKHRYEDDGSSGGQRSSGGGHGVSVSRPQPRRGGGGDGGGLGPRDSFDGYGGNDSDAASTPRRRGDAGMDLNDGRQSPADESLIVGHGTYTLERYRILRRLGEGAFSVVYLVERKADGLLFALKHLECSTDDSRHDAMQECELIRSLQGHPNVIMLYDMYMNFEFGNGDSSTQVLPTVSEHPHGLPPPAQAGRGKPLDNNNNNNNKKGKPINGNAAGGGRKASAATEWFDFSQQVDASETAWVTRPQPTAGPSPTTTTTTTTSVGVSSPPAEGGGATATAATSAKSGVPPAPNHHQVKKPSRHLCLVTQFHPLGDLKRWTLQQGQQPGGPAHRYLGRASTPTNTPRSLTPRPGSLTNSANLTMSSSAPFASRFAPLHASEVVLTSIAFQIMSVLYNLHHEQDPPILHRDLKPENILLVDPAHPVLTAQMLDEMSVLSVNEGGYAPPTKSPRPYLSSTTNSGALSKSPGGGGAISILGSATGPTAAAGGGAPPFPLPPRPPAPQTHYPIEFLPIVVTDFGLARLLEADDVLTQGAGTLPYVAPECLTKQRYSTPCDMWSLGCVLFAVATRRVRGDNVRLLSQEVGTMPLQSFQVSLASELLPLGISKHFLRFLFLLLQPDPAKRLTAEQGRKLFRRYGDRVCLGRRRVAFLSKKTNGGCIFDLAVQQAIPIRRGVMLLQYPPKPVALSQQQQQQQQQEKGASSSSPAQGSPLVQHARQLSSSDAGGDYGSVASLEVGASTRTTAGVPQDQTHFSEGRVYSGRRDSDNLLQPPSTRTSTATMYTCEDVEDDSTTFLDTLSDAPSAEGDPNGDL